MAGINRVILLGKKQDPIDYAQSPEGIPYARFLMFTEVEAQNRKGESYFQKEWHRILVWGELTQYLKKMENTEVWCFVEGQIQTTEWIEQGRKLSFKEILVDNIYFCE